MSVSRASRHRRLSRTSGDGYALSPIDLIPDFIPILGYLDDMVIVPLGILAVIKLVPPDIMAEHRTTAAAVAERPTSLTAAVVIAAIWVVSIGLVGWWVYRRFPEPTG
jgi:uncharacterized membrane protein YkvA (DUF1232 family)